MFIIETFIVGIPTFFLAIEPHDKKFTGKFFRNIMKEVIPGALFILANLMGVYLFFGVFYEDIYIIEISDQITTVGIISATFAYFLILMHQSHPLNKLRIALLFFAAITSALCFTVLKDVFEISPLTMPAVLMMLLLMETTYIGMSLYHKRFI
jgi:cation-transporting ATPase E